MSRQGKAKKIIAVIGFGSQGRAIALNLQDSGFKVIVGLKTRSASRKKVLKAGLEAKTIKLAVESADIVCFAFPDHLHGRVFKKSIGPYLRESATLLFLHGTSYHFGLVKPAKVHDVIMIAPHAPGNAVREKFEGDRSISAFYAIEQNYSGKAMQTIKQIAAGIGFKSERLIKTTFHDEAVGDLFGEQAVLCGGLAGLIKSGFETLVEGGIKPDHAYLEVVYQLDLIVELIKRHGIEGMFRQISVAAKFGSLQTEGKLIDSSVKKRMKARLKSIESGKFARELNSLEADDIKQIDRELKKLSNRQLEKAARKFRQNR